MSANPAPERTKKSSQKSSAVKVPPNRNAWRRGMSKSTAGRPATSSHGSAR